MIKLPTLVPPVVPPARDPTATLPFTAPRIFAALIASELRTCAYAAIEEIRSLLTSAIVLARATPASNSREVALYAPAPIAGL